MYSPHVPQLSHMTGHVTSSPHAMGYMSPYGSVPTSPAPPPLDPLHYPTTPITVYTPSTPTTSTVLVSPGGCTESRTDPEFLSSGSSSHVMSLRKDGRRSVSLNSGDMPRLSEVSSLYGQPAWWGDEVKTKGDTSRTAHREAQILRDISPPQSRSSSVSDCSIVSSKAVRTAAKGTVYSDLEVSGSTSSAWTIETGPRQSRAIPPKWRRHVRSADSSPIRKPGSERRSISSNVTPVRTCKNAAVSDKNFTPLSRRVTASKPPSGSQKVGRKNSPSSPMTTGTESSTKPRDCTKQKELITKREGSKTVNRRTSSSTRKATSNVQSDPIQGPGSDNTSPPPPLPLSVGLSSQSETGLGSKEKADETFVVTSPTEEDERPGSARRQWSHEPDQVRVVSSSVDV